MLLYLLNHLFEKYDRETVHHMLIPMYHANGMIINAYSSISWNGLSQTVHLVSPSSSSSLSSSMVPLCCEAVNDEYSSDHKCSVRIGGRSAGKSRNFITLYVRVCMDGWVSRWSWLYKLQPPVNDDT